MYPAAWRPRYRPRAGGEAGVLLAHHDQGGRRDLDQPCWNGWRASYGSLGAHAFIAFGGMWSR